MTLLKNGLSVRIEDLNMLEQWHLPTEKSMTIRDVWAFLIESVCSDLDLASQHALEHILTYGNMSDRLVRASNKDPLTSIYRQLGDCLLSNKQFQTL